MKYIVVDIDGTVADCSHRIHFIQPQGPFLQPLDWDGFYNACDRDTPIRPVIDVLRGFWNTHQIVFCTGRRESVRGKTSEWLYKHVVPQESPQQPGFTLLMRKDGDHRHDTEVKPELLKNAIGSWGEKIVQEDVAFIIEDRKSMVKKWRELGYICFQVAEGDF